MANPTPCSCSGKGPTLLYAFDPDTEAFSYIGDQSEDDRDYVAEVRGLLADGEWRIVKEIAAPAAAGGIAANDKIVKKVLDEHPDLFESRTGDDAKALGRSPQATLWQLRPSVSVDDDNITWAEFEDAALDLQHRTGSYINPMKDVIAEARRAREDGEES